MNQIDKMIEKYCPNGVDFCELKQSLDYEQPTKYIVSSTEYDDDNPIPVLTAGDSFVLGYTGETDGIYKASKNNPVIIFDDFTTSFHWVDFNFKVKSSAMKMLTPKDNVNFRYIYHVMNNIIYKPSEHSRQWISKYSTFKIPMPHPQIQEKIVEILDKFVILTEELTEELSCRKKQYNHYRSQLLTFGEKSDFEWKSLKDVTIKTSSGGTPLSTKKEYYDGDIPWLRTQEVCFGEINETAVKITELAVKETSAKWIPENCVIIAISGATAGRSAINKIPLTTNQHCCNLEINPEIADYRYVFHWVCSEYERIKALGRGARSDLNAGIIKNYKIPIPYPNDSEKSIAEQKRIVSILDKFDKLTTDISDGLPAEIKARHQQYEYYRNKLLTFKEANSD